MTAGRGNSLRVRAAVGPAAALLMSACAWLGQSLAPSEEAPPTQYDRAITLLEAQSFVAADVMLRRLAGACENGADGRRAMLLLASVWLDPRNALANADSAALLAARFLSLPDSDPVERVAARSIYVLALELGADPQLRPARTEGPDRLALTFSNCGGQLPEVLAELPKLDREPLGATIRRLERQRDSLATRSSGLADGSRTLERRVQELAAELQTAQAEIQRIRRLLSGRDTTGVGPGPR